MHALALLIAWVSQERLCLHRAVAIAVKEVAVPSGEVQLLYTIRHSMHVSSHLAAVTAQCGCSDG